MEEFTQKIAMLFESPQMIALITAAFSYISANFVTLIVFVVKYLKLKTKELKEKSQNEEVQMSMKAEYEAKLDALCTKIDARLTSVENNVLGRVKELDEEKQKMIEEQSIQLKQAVKETKKALTIDDVLED